MGWLALGLSVVCVIETCAALARPLASVDPDGPTGPRLQADYSPWLPTTFGPVLNTLLVEAAKDLNLAGSAPREWAGVCLLPEGRCTPEAGASLVEATPIAPRADPAGVRACGGVQDAKCKPSASQARP